MTPMSKKPDYGIDAPGVIRNLFLLGMGCLLIGLLGPPTLQIGPVNLTVQSFLYPAGSLLAPAGLMLLYALHGKFGHRDRMLAFHAWRGDEQVLDVGTGRGLMLVGAARRLSTGRAIGLDIWNKEDLSGNSLQSTEHNLQLEAVTDRCSLVSESADKMSFADGAFDVIVSNLCLHNIYDQAARHKACGEIVRVLRPGGVAIISDYKLTREYAKLFSQAGLQVERKPANWLTTFPPLAIVVARKR
jgi:arsenite methyltransferase